MRSDIEPEPSRVVTNYTRTYAKKLKENVDIKKVIEEEVVERNNLF